MKKVTKVKKQRKEYVCTMFQDRTPISRFHLSVGNLNFVIINHNLSIHIIETRYFHK